MSTSGSGDVFYNTYLDETIWAILVKGLRRDICVKLFIVLPSGVGGDIV